MNAAKLPVPDLLRESADKALAALREDEALAPLLQRKKVLAPLTRVLACSPFAARSFTRRPGVLNHLLSEDRLDRPLEPGELGRLAGEALGECRQEPSFMREIRWFRHREMCRILWRDLNGSAAWRKAWRN